MSTYTLVTLDTTAPVVTWGTITGAVITEELTAPYTSDEALAYAWLVLPDLREIAMTIHPDRLTVMVPGDAPEGTGYIKVTDDVGNPSVHKEVHISGVIPVQTTPTQGLPQVARGERRFGLTQARITARYRTGVFTDSTGSGRVVTRWVMPAVPRDVRTTLVGRSLWSQAVTHVGSRSAVGVESSAIITRRPEGPDAEDDLIFLGLI